MFAIRIVYGDGLCSSFQRRCTRRFQFIPGLRVYPTKHGLFVLQSLYDSIYSPLDPVYNAWEFGYRTWAFRLHWTIFPPLLRLLAFLRRGKPPNWLSTTATISMFQNIEAQNCANGEDRHALSNDFPDSRSSRCHLSKTRNELCFPARSYFGHFKENTNAASTQNTPVLLQHSLCASLWGN